MAHEGPRPAPDGAHLLFAAVTGALLVLVTAAFFAAMAQQTLPCAPYDKVVDFLSEKFDEHPVGHGRTGETANQLFVADDGKTWTIVTVQEDGIACLTMTGEHWKMTAPRSGRGT